MSSLARLEESQVEESEMYQLVWKRWYYEPDEYGTEEGRAVFAERSLSASVSEATTSAIGTVKMMKRIAPRLQQMKNE